MAIALPLQAASREAAYNFKTEDVRFDSLSRLILRHEVSRSHDRKNKEWVSQLNSIADASHNPVLKSRASFWSIRTNQLSAAPDSCIRILEKAKQSLPRTYDYDYATIAYQLAGNYSRMGKYFQTYQLLQEAIEIFQEYDDLYFLGNAHLLMGLLYLDILDYPGAMEEIDLAGRYYSKCGYPLNRIHFFKALLSKDDNEKIRLLQKSISEGRDEPGTAIQAYGSIIEIQLKREQPDSALHYVGLGRKMLDDSAEPSPLLRVLLNISEARALYALGDYDKALDLLRQTESFAEKYTDEQWESSIYKLMSEIYEKKGLPNQAYGYLKKYVESYEREVKAATGQEIQKSQARDAINRQKVEMVEMKQEVKNAHNRFIIILLVLVAVLLMTAGIIVYLRQRVKLRKIENRELRSNLEQEMIIKRLNMENFERDMKKKECEISSSVLLLSNKNDVLQQIRDIAKKYYDNGQVPPEFVKQVNELVSDSIKGDDEWTRFKKHFDSVHPEFFTKLKAASDELTENDIRLCAYIRIGMRAKDIASMLSVSPASVNSNRYRIRKKLNLGKEISLDDFIRNI